MKPLPSLGLIMLLLSNTNCAPAHEYALSDHFDGSKFFDNERHHTLPDEIKWFWNIKTVEWPGWIDDPEQPPPPPKVDGGELRIAYINQATLLIQMDGLNILTDPIWSFRAGPVAWLGSKRVRAPGIKSEDLPKIDIILISHDHYDHLDLRTLKQLSDVHDFVILCGLGIKKILGGKKIGKGIELDWWQEYSDSKSGVKFTFVPAYHESGRGPFNSNRTLWGGFVIEGSKRIYFAGDTAYGKFLRDIKSRYKHFNMAILPVGNYEKRWIMKTMHMNPDEAVQTHKLLNVDQSVGMHFGTFLEHPEQSIDSHEKDITAALMKYNVPDERFWILKFGEGRYVK